MPPNVPTFLNCHQQWVKILNLCIIETKNKTKNKPELWYFSSVQFSSVAQSCPTLCSPMNRSTPGLPVHHQLLEFTQTHVRILK